MIFTKLSRGVMLAATLFLLPTITHAGMDEIHVVTKLTGKAWVRQAILKTGTPGPKWYKNPKFGNWHLLHKGEVVDPVSEVRTEPGATVWLQMGNEIEDITTYPRDSYLRYYVVEPNSTVRCNSQYDVRHTDLVKTLHGKMHIVTTYGKAPVPKP